MATMADIPRLVEFRALMFTDMGLDASGEWSAAASEWFRSALGDPRFHIVVVEIDGRLVSCGMGELQNGAPAPSCPNGRTVYVSNVVTERADRGRGHARRCMDELLRWAREDVAADRVELHASSDGLALYRKLGFVAAASPSMRLRIGSDERTPPSGLPQT